MILAQKQTHKPFKQNQDQKMSTNTKFSNLVFDNDEKNNNKQTKNPPIYWYW